MGLEVRMHSREPVTVWGRAVDAAGTWPQEVIRLRVLVGGRRPGRRRGSNLGTMNPTKATTNTVQSFQI